MLMKVVITDKLAPEGVDILKQAGHDVKESWDIPKEELPTNPDFQSADAIIIRSATSLKGELLDAAKNVKVIGRAGIGLDNVDLDKAKERGIIVINTPAATTITVAELAFASHAFHFPKNIVFAYQKNIGVIAALSFAVTAGFCRCCCLTYEAHENYDTYEFHVFASITAC